MDCIVCFRLPDFPPSFLPRPLSFHFSRHSPFGSASYQTGRRQTRTFLPSPADLKRQHNKNKSGSHLPSPARGPWRPRAWRRAGLRHSPSRTQTDLSIQVTTHTSMSRRSSYGTRDNLLRSAPFDGLLVDEFASRGENFRVLSAISNCKHKWCQFRGGDRHFSSPFFLVSAEAAVLLMHTEGRGGFGLELSTGPEPSLN